MYKANLLTKTDTCILFHKSKCCGTHEKHMAEAILMSVTTYEFVTN